jgi:hypothetical protein
MCQQTLLFNIILTPQLPQMLLLETEDAPRSFLSILFLNAIEFTAWLYSSHIIWKTFKQLIGHLHICQDLVSLERRGFPFFVRLVLSYLLRL